MRASRQTELQREFPLHVVCSWLGNSPRIAQQSYLLVTEDDFQGGWRSEGDGGGVSPLKVRGWSARLADERPESTLLRHREARGQVPSCLQDKVTNIYYAL